MVVNFRRTRQGGLNKIAGWSSQVARQAHNLKAAGSNPAPATRNTVQEILLYGVFLCVESPVIRWPQGRVELDFAHHKVPNFSAFVYKGEVPGQIEARK